MSDPTVRIAVDCRNLLGEGPVWDVADGALYWVDIEGRLLQRFVPAREETTTWRFDRRPTAVTRRAAGGFVGAFDDGFARFDPETGEIDYFARPEAELAGNRMNDGRCDREGRLWVGSMNEATQEPTGNLYRLEPDFSLTRMETGIAISNSISFSPDGGTLYFADTPTDQIRAYDVTADGLANRRTFATTGNPGHPDGSTVDAEGYLWNAEWDGWRVVRYAPDGTVDRVIALPVQRPTCCMFGGPNLTTLFITSASTGLSEAERVAQPHAGSLLAVDLPIKGLPEQRFPG